MQDFQNAAAGMARIQELLCLQQEPGRAGAAGAGLSDARAAGLPAGPLSVEMQDLTFKYAEGVTALDGVSLRLEPGRTLGVVGRTGSGKSTLARLMLRFHDPSAGRILVGGTEVRDAGLDALRGRVALVTQEVQLFKATVRDNLTMFDNSVPDESSGPGGCPHG